MQSHHLLNCFSATQRPHLENKAVVLDDFLGPFQLFLFQDLWVIKKTIVLLRLKI